MLDGMSMSCCALAWHQIMRAWLTPDCGMHHGVCRIHNSAVAGLGKQLQHHAQCTLLLAVAAHAAKMGAETGNSEMCHFRMQQPLRSLALPMQPILP